MSAKIINVNITTSGVRKTVIRVFPDYDTWSAFCSELSIGPTTEREIYKWWRRYFYPGEYDKKFFKKGAVK
jgi:hypothetical protein